MILRCSLKLTQAVKLPQNLIYFVLSSQVHKRIPDEDFISVTGYEGERFYLTLKDEKDVEKERKENLTSESRKLAQLEEEAELLTNNLKEKENDRIGNVPVDDDDHSHVKKLLWVEKYAPAKYLDLLSEESINRILLHWLKLWDFLVFGKEKKVRKKEKEAEKKGNKDFKKKKLPEVTDELDKQNRPVQKIVLLNGPPGLGKTTLAHIVAKHCGYNVVEINASDDRSADIFKTKLEAATQMRAVLGADPKPNCLVIDEIDGAPQAAINVLMSYIRRQDEPTAKKKKKDEALLLRPVICICNDQYTPSLRVLRQNALVLNFPPTELAKLASRLSEVVKTEDMRVDMNTLMVLCAKTENDIRSCINTLQFCKTAHKELSVRLLDRMNVGQKDANKNLFSVWYEIFSKPKPKRRPVIGESVEPERNSNSLESRADNILHVVQGSGEYSKLTMGIFENFLQCKVKDPKLDGMKSSLDWLCFTDQINKFMGTLQDYRPMPYLPYSAVNFHLIYAANQPHKIQYPYTDYEAFTKQTKLENLVSTMMSDMTAYVQKFISKIAIVMDLLPPLMDIIQPTFRPVNTQLYSTREKEELSNLVRTMIAYNMTYHQEKSPEGQYLYVLDPNMEEVIRFSGMKQHKQLTYAAKQLISREIELERLRRKENRDVTNTSKEKNQEKKVGDKSNPVVPNHLQKLEAKPLAQIGGTMVQKDFFGRVIKRKSLENKPQAKTENKKKNVLQTDIWFHFTEGFSNAVRRNVKVKDFL
ncbi:hypothetical protein FSP39_023205 [Pinctada imbricata]|uniref:AAA+ ATPase domain-containing protein n=1 Tax=Pinctada imbricata TaxID=66713 RepID=A0AA88Y9A0_PINIB|nr:hypothetical protein FSP39_023205 [Pinctada imbricata]